MMPMRPGDFGERLNRGARATLAQWIDWLRDRPDCNGGVGTVGWCYGGGWWTLNVPMATPVAATGVCYGRRDTSLRQVIRLAGPVTANTTGPGPEGSPRGHQLQSGHALPPLVTPRRGLPENQYPLYLLNARSRKSGCRLTSQK